MILPSAENGLFSRFMFYVMNIKIVWKDVFAFNTADGLDNHFAQLGTEFYTLYQLLMSNPEIQFSLTQNQQHKFNQFFAEKQNLYVAIQEDNIVGTVRRLGLTAFRMMMVFTALRIMENGEITNQLTCTDTDFENTLSIVETLLKHSSYIFNQIAEQSHQPKPKKRKKLFLEQLPYEFNRQTYVNIAQSLGIPDKTAQGYIKTFIDSGIVLHPSQDYYINTTAPNPQKS